MSKKRTKIRSSLDANTSSRPTTQAVAKWTEPAPEVVYAIRVLTRRDGKPRKRKAWARENSKGRWWIGGQSLAWLIIGGRLSVWVGSQIMKGRACDAESALGCKCAVVAIELRERPV